MRELDRPVVALIERRAADEAVMRHARLQTAAQGAPLVLVHVAPLATARPPGGTRWQGPPEPWQRMLGLEATISYDLRALAREWVGPATPVDVEVRFGDPVDELATAAAARGARLVIACSRPARWPFGQGRDGRLHRAVNRPLLLVRVARDSWRAGRRLPPAPVEVGWRP